jgi:ribonuclease HI
MLVLPEYQLGLLRCIPNNGLQLLNQMGCNRIIVNSDSTCVIEAMRHEGNYLEPAADVLNNCKQLTRKFLRATFIHCPRESTRGDMN